MLSMQVEKAAKIMLQRTLMNHYNLEEKTENM